jgi:hypothetical protein
MAGGERTMKRHLKPPVNSAKGIINQVLFQHDESGIRGMGEAVYNHLTLSLVLAKYWYEFKYAVWRFREKKYKKGES